MSKDYYKILGVEKGASPEQIKKAFRELAHKHHPDKSGGNEAKFKEINEAYQVLSNPQKRQQYDQFGSDFSQAGGGSQGFGGFANGFGGGAGNAGFNFEGDLGDIFGDLFGMGGGRRNRSAQQTGADIQIGLTISFHDAVFGTEKTFNLEKDQPCSHCKGNGAEPGSKIHTCATCHGSGRVTQNIGFGIGFANTCPTCHGEGKKAEKNCSVCHGRGVTKEQKTIKIKIPAGIDNGQSIRLTGEGQVAKNGSTGDLYVTVQVIADPNFVRQGYDIISQKEISFSQAALGDKIDIETIDGKVKLKIPEGTQSGKVFRLKGRGVSHVNGRGRGDQLVKVIVKTPSRLSKKEKQLFEELQKISQ
ncbi:MAG: molecular chaperone DnaJ [Candidatus Buchananbacteria bacterium]|nr:molecular chaperone DnaJ [Candidatus Buchananbacteria bacterium]